MHSVAIEIKGLRKKFGEQNVLNGIELRVPKGKVFALLGPNGAGKTTLINILSTLVMPDSGSVKVGGYDVQSEMEEVKNTISLTGQFAAVDELLTAEENLMMMGRLFGLSRHEAREKTKELLNHFELAPVSKKRVKTYSGGMRRRLDLAVSLVVHREILFLDEPTTGLDTSSRRTLWEIIKKLADRGVTVFLTTQYLEEADQLADRIAVMANGRIVAEGTPEEMKSQISGEVLELRTAQDELLKEFPTNGTLEEIKQILTGLGSGISGVTKISIRRPSLDDVFLAVDEKPE